MARVALPARVMGVETEKMDMDSIRAALIAAGWPEHARDTRHCSLVAGMMKPYGRFFTVFEKGRGFHGHWEGDNRVVFGQNREACLKALIRLMEPDVESIEIIGNSETEQPRVVSRPIA